MGKLNLVDLAGSERQSKTGSTVSTSLPSDVPVLVMNVRTHLVFWSDIRTVCTSGKFGQRMSCS